MTTDFKPIVGYGIARVLSLVDAYEEASIALHANQCWDDTTVEQAKAAKVAAKAKLLSVITQSYQAGHNAGVAHHKQATLHMRENAGRYRWLRQQHWSTSTIAVVLDPKKNVELGATLPSLEDLDAEIDRLRGVS